MGTDWKQMINNLLFIVLNDRTTLREFEDIAVSFYEVIVAHNDKKTREE